MGAPATTAVTPQAVAAATVRVGEPGYVGEVLHWVTTRPGDAGLSRLVRDGAGGVQEVSPPGCSVRSALYGYGAGAWSHAGSALAVLDAVSRSLLVLGDGGARVALEPGVRLGDPCAIPGTTEVLVVAESVRGAALWAADAATGRHVVLREAQGFVAEPVVDATGERLAWLEWPRGRMPWDAASVWRAELVRDGGALALRRPRRVDGGEGNSAGQACWLDDSTLAYVAESTGWWQPWIQDRGGVVRRLSGRRAEFQRPRWTTTRWLAPLDVDRLACAWADADGEHVGVLGLDGDLDVLEQPCVRVDGICASAGRIGITGASVAGQGVVLEVALRGLGVREVTAAPRDDPSVPRPERFRVTVGDHDVPGVLWRPTARVPEGPAPFVVSVHPGPTGATDRSYAGVVHLLCANGAAVVSLDTSGSTAHGRAHRERLLGRFGELDVAECAAALDALVSSGVADPGACVARGTSSGGTTALLLLARGAVAGAIAWYPATDLAGDEVGFEEGYLDALTGGHGAQRSPLAVASRLAGRVLLVQGRDDPIVPVRATEAFAEALGAAGVHVRLVVLDGEGHGLRRPESRAAALAAELEFLGAVTASAVAPRYDVEPSHSTPPPARP